MLGIALKAQVRERRREIWPNSIWVIIDLGQIVIQDIIATVAGTGWRPPLIVSPVLNPRGAVRSLEQIEYQLDPMKIQSAPGAIGEIEGALEVSL